MQCWLIVFFFAKKCKRATFANRERSEKLGFVATIQAANNQQSIGLCLGSKKTQQPIAGYGPASTPPEAFRKSTEARGALERQPPGYSEDYSAIGSLAEAS